LKIKAFKGIRPKPELASKVACRPYDVLDTDEAREEARGNAYSFLNVVKPEITLPPEIDHYAPEVYEAGRDNFKQLIEQGVFIQDKKDCIYIYELTMDGRSQSGIVACASVDDYIHEKIKKHELTRPDKENDRKNLVRVSMINAEPVFFAYKTESQLDQIVKAVKQNPVVYDFVADDDVRHRIWVVEDEDTIGAIINIFAGMDSSYVADGHHRTAAAALVGIDLSKENPAHKGDEEYNYFLAVHFPDNQLAIFDYNRVVKDLSGHTPESFLQAISGAFKITRIGKQAYKPQSLHEMGMYLDREWYCLKANPDTYDDNDPIGVLDVTILSEQVLKPVLDINDLRTDSRIEFVGGIRGLRELERRVDSGEMAVAFAMYPVSMKQLMEIADNGLIMPPKVTWFEPKLRSGLLVHSLAQ
jgi:uncharacterized protein (DUF1015 family)